MQTVLNDVTPPYFELEEVYTIWFDCMHNISHVPSKLLWDIYNNLE